MRRLGPLSERLTVGLRAEAFACHRNAIEVHRAEPTDEDRRRGDPARWLESAPGGNRLAAFYRAHALTALLGRLTGIPWSSSGEQATYSYYRRAGHHLGMHRDVEWCDLAVIICVDHTGAPLEGGTALELHPARSGEPISAIRARPEGGISLPLAPGQALVLLGGIVAHRLPPVAAGEVRIVAPLCFRAGGIDTQPCRPPRSPGGRRECQ